MLTYYGPFKHFVTQFTVTSSSNSLSLELDDQGRIRSLQTTSLGISYGSFQSDTRSSRWPLMATTGVWASLPVVTFKLRAVQPAGWVTTSCPPWRMPQHGHVCVIESSDFSIPSVAMLSTGPRLFKKSEWLTHVMRLSEETSAVEEYYSAHTPPPFPSFHFETDSSCSILPRLNIPTSPVGLFKCRSQTQLIL